MSAARPPEPETDAAQVFALRQTFWRNGFRPVAVYTKQKRPRGNGWLADAMTDPPLWATRQPEGEALSTGLACGRLAGIDVDVRIQAVVDRIIYDTEKELGVTPLVRIGYAPKTLIAYRANAPFRKLATETFIMPDGSEAKVEILADGQQFVADGIHPDTGLPYLWPAGSPETVPLANAPPITFEQAQAVVARARDVLIANGGVAKPPPGGQRETRQAAAGGAEGFFAQTNQQALANLAGWVRALFPCAVYHSRTHAYRVPSKDLGRPLQEDLSIHPAGIQDWGEERGLTPIDLVMAHGGVRDAAEAAIWLCEHIGIDPASLGWRQPRRAEGPAPRPNGADHAPPPPRGGRILSGANFIADHVPPVWLIDGIVQRSRLYACTSLTGHGKTAVWLFNACMIHAGRMIGHLDAFQGNVLVLAGENPSDLKARMIGMAKAYNLPPDQLPYVLPGSFPMTEDEADALKRDIAGLRVPLAAIIGDTASSFFPGDDENSNVQAGGYARTLRSFTEGEGKPAVVVLSHPTKGASRDNLLPRGGSAFLNELDGNLALWSNSQGEVTEMHWCAKIRGPDFSAFGYRLRTVPTGLIDEKNRPEITIIAEPMSEEAIADHTKQTLANEDVVLRALRDHPEWSQARIAREAGWINDADEPMKPRVQRAIQRLATDKLVNQERHGAPWTITEKGRAVLDGDELGAAKLKPEKAADPKPAMTPTKSATPIPSEAEIEAEIERIADLSDAAFLTLNREALAIRLNCKPHEVPELRRRARTAKANKAKAARNPA